ncbi:hypothetical protein ACQPYK_44350 [Streptosporangium sp. CA-135522]|uniref:hypothetical protein n=1 Tax=Streptosporangium sp. CA-135522 TaxID=3240072 RepID=UPI003D93F70A
MASSAIRYAGSGKTEFSRFLSDITGWAFLDKDSLTRCIVERLLVLLTARDPRIRRNSPEHALARRRSLDQELYANRSFYSPSAWMIDYDILK